MSSRVAVENLSSVNPQLLENVVHEHLKSAVQGSGDTTLDVSSVNGGKPMQVTLGQIHKEVEVPPLTCEEVITIQSEANLSDK